MSIVVIVFPGLLGQLSLDALPGDLLYPVKRHNESVALSTAMSWEQRDEMLVEQADRRLSEAQAVATVRPSQILPAVSDVGAIMEELERSPVAETRSRVHLIRGDVQGRLAALMDAVSEPAREGISVAVEDIITADGRPSAAASARPLAKSEGARERPADTDERVAVARADQPPVTSAGRDTDLAAVPGDSAAAPSAGGTTAAPSATETATGMPTSPASPAGAPLDAPTTAAEVASPSALPSPTTATHATEAAGGEPANCAPTATATSLPDGVTDPSSPPDVDADAPEGSDACSTTGSLPTGGTPTDVQPQESPDDDAVTDEPAIATDEDTDVPATTVEGEGTSPEVEPSPDEDAVSTRPPDDEPLPAPVPRPDRDTSERDPSAPVSADGAAQTAGGHTASTDAGASTTP